MKFLIRHLHAECYIYTSEMSVLVPTVNSSYCSTQFPTRHLSSECYILSSVKKCMDGI